MSFIQMSEDPETINKWWSETNGCCDIIVPPASSFAFRFYEKGIPPIFKKKHFFQLFWAIVKRNLNSRTTTCKEMRAWDNLTKWNGSTRFTIYFPTLDSNHCCTLPIPIQQTFSYAKIIWNFFDSCVFMQNIKKTIFFFILQTIMCSACWWGRYER